MGARLGRLLTEQIDKISEESGDTKEEIMERAGTRAGISGSTVGQIVDGSIQCPPLNRLAGIADALGMGRRTLLRAAESDGCEFGGSDR